MSAYYINIMASKCMECEKWSLKNGICENCSLNNLNNVKQGGGARWNPPHGEC